MNKLLMTFYGDDFTGSTDALEALAVGGVPTVLFTEPPSAAQVARDFPDVRAVGVAGTSRAMTLAEMTETLPSVFKTMQSLGAPLFHYKVCSTFDSSPTIGSIGRALELGEQVFQPRFTPIIVGTPTLRRYVAFGNLFATAVGVDGQPVTHRIDRHPTMAHHPVTPMHESDLRRHLAAQTDRAIGLVDVVTLSQPAEVIDQAIATQIEAGAAGLLFDTIDDSHITAVGQMLLRHMARKSLFAIGSSGVESALTRAWQQQGIVAPPLLWQPPVPAGQIVVMAGSASPATAEQIVWAEAHGFVSIGLDAALSVDPTSSEAACATYCREALAALSSGKSVLLYSTRGPIAKQPQLSGAELGVAQGRLLRAILEESTVRRVCIAGGDTCGRVVQQLGIRAMTMAAPLAPGAPLCRAHAPGTPFDGLELALKGGQVGGVDYFGRVRGSA